MSIPIDRKIKTISKLIFTYLSLQFCNSLLFVLFLLLSQNLRNQQRELQTNFANRLTTFLAPSVILETEGRVQKVQKKAFFHYKKVKKGTLILTSPYVHSLFTIVLIKNFFEKNKSSRAASGSRTQF